MYMHTGLLPQSGISYLWSRRPCRHQTALWGSSSSWWCSTRRKQNSAATEYIRITIVRRVKWQYPLVTLKWTAFYQLNCGEMWTDNAVGVPRRCERRRFWLFLLVHLTLYSPVAFYRRHSVRRNKTFTQYSAMVQIAISLYCVHEWVHYDFNSVLPGCI